MKAALIPPKGCYHTALESDYHLVLAQLRYDKEYLNTYRQEPVGYIIVDNGAAEGATVCDEELMEAASLFRADEIVVPDVMQNAEATLQRAEEFMTKFGDAEYRFMLVAQGRTRQEIEKCIKVYRRNWADAVIGLPRHLLETLNNLSARVSLLRHIEERYGQIEVHLLGTNPIHPVEVRRLAAQHPWVRGIDSSMPYNHTIAEDLLELTDIVPSPYNLIRRPEGYFSKEWHLGGRLLASNIETYMRWASGTEGTRR